MTCELCLEKGLFSMGLKQHHLCRSHFRQWQQWWELNYGEECRQMLKAWLNRDKKGVPLYRGDIWERIFDEFLSCIRENGN